MWGFGYANQSRSNTFAFSRSKFRFEEDTTKRNVPRRSAENEMSTAAENEMSTVAEKEASTALANLKAAARRGLGVYLRWEDAIWRPLIVAGVAVMYMLLTTVIAESRAKAGVSPIYTLLNYIFMVAMLIIVCIAPRRN
jgi:hypothetical protein